MILGCTEPTSPPARAVAPTMSATWCQCFAVYAAALIPHQPARLADLMAYQSLIARASQKYKWPAWPKLPPGGSRQPLPGMGQSRPEHLCPMLYGAGPEWRELVQQVPLLGSYVGQLPTTSQKADLEYSERLCQLCRTLSHCWEGAASLPEVRPLQRRLQVRQELPLSAHL